MIVLPAPHRRSRERSPASSSVGLRCSEIIIALLMFATFATFRRREIWQLIEGSGFDAEIKIKIFAWLFFGLFAATQWQKILANSYLLFKPPLLFFFLLWLLSLVSTVYSISPELTLFRAYQLGVVLAFGLLWADRVDNWPTLAMIYIGLNWAFLAIGVTNMVDGMGWRDLPAYQEAGFGLDGQPWRFGTPIGHFSVISIVASATLIVVCARMPRNPSIIDLIIVVWLVATLLLTVSRTAIAGVVLGLLVLVALRGKLTLVLLCVVALTAPLLSYPPALDATASFLKRGQTVEELETLTNRTSIYDSALAVVGDNWPLGIGYRASRAVVLDEQADGRGVAHAHNAVLEAAVSLGIGGVILAVLVLMSVLGCSIFIFLRERQQNQPQLRNRGAEFVALSVPIVAYSMLDSGFMLDVFPFILMFVAILVDLTRRVVSMPLDANENHAKRRSRSNINESPEL